jgi:hypothetical protein
VTAERAEASRPPERQVKMTSAPATAMSAAADATHTQAGTVT